MFSDLILIQIKLCILLVFVYDYKIMFYVIGLGNPGEQYESTRHNVGRILLEQIAQGQEFGVWEKDKHAQALVNRGSISEVPVEFLLPETFMNKSGETGKFLVKKQGAKPDEIVVVYDDVDLPLGEMKISVGRGAGGHNGIDSIVKALGSKDFIRIRIGISPKSFWTGKTKRPAGHTLSRYVLGRFTRGEMEKVREVGERAVGALQVILTEGVAKAMNTFN